jgi:hypothetical protein
LQHRELDDFLVDPGVQVQAVDEAGDVPAGGEDVSAR